MNHINKYESHEFNIKLINFIYERGGDIKHMNKIHNNNI